MNIIVYIVISILKAKQNVKPTLSQKNHWMPFRITNWPELWQCIFNIRRLFKMHHSFLRG